MPGTPIYMDHHATTPIDPRVGEAMAPYLGETFGNAASRSHAHGQRAGQAVEVAREQVAGLLGAKPEEVVFTSGATESDNLALKGGARAVRAKGSHIITVRTEHKAVLDSCAALEREGFSVTYLDVDAKGAIDLGALSAAITQDTVLISAMLSNNEVGTVQDIDGVAEIAAERDILFHCDAAQGVGYIPLIVTRTPVDLVSLSAHKLYGPKGVGALYVSQSVQDRGIPVPLIDGGGHERGLRAGTLNVAGIVGFGRAAELVTKEGASEATRIEALRDQLKERLFSGLEEVRLNGAAAPRHPGNLNVSFGYVDGAKLLLELAPVVSVSSGAACSSAAEGPSYVLEAMGVEKEWAAASVRFGLGRATTQAEVETVADAVIQTVNQLRERSAQWELRAKGIEADW